MPTFQSSDVGTPTLAGSTTVTTETDGTKVYTIVGGGDDIWNNSDNFHYYWARVKAGFDVVVKVRDLQGPDAWSKAELMVRMPEAEDSEPQGGDPHYSMMTTRTAGQNEVHAQWRQTRAGGSQWPRDIGDVNVFRPAYPNTWLRMQRIGNTFIGSWGTDGQNWTHVYTRNFDELGITWPETVFVGLAVTAHNNTDTTGATAVFSNLEFRVAAPDITKILPRNRSSYVNINTNFIFSVSSVKGVNTSDIKLKVNGVDKSSGLTFSGNANERNVSYAGPFTANTFYTFNIETKDVDGRTSTATVTWDTMSDANFTIEAEDFNFENGKFIDNIVLSSAPADNNYLDKVGVQGVDRFTVTTDGDHFYRIYDVNTSTGEAISTTQIGGAELSDYLRRKYVDAQNNDPGVFDYKIGWNQVGEWWNYTRTFPAGVYKVYGRYSYGGGTPFSVQVDQVVSGSTTANQTLLPLGTFRGTPTGDYNNFALFPLTDVFGREVIVPLSGAKTLRGTLTTGGMDANFWMFVPVTDAGTLKPYVALATPVPNATGVSPGVIVQASIVDRNTKVNTGTIKMWIDDGEVTPTVTPNAAGANLSFAPAQFFSQGVTHKIKLEFEDNASPANKVTEEWSFTTASGIPIIPQDFARGINSGSERGLSIRITQTTDENNSIQSQEDQLAGRILPIRRLTYAKVDVINFEQNATANTGNVTGDTTFPGFDAADHNALTAEIVCWIPLTRGSYTFGVNSDDGFRVTAVKTPGSVAPIPNGSDANAITLGYYSDGRGAANTDFTFLVEKDGIYPFRTTWEEGNGGASVEFYSLTPTGQRILINGTDAQAVRVYRYSTEAPNTAITFTSQPTNTTVIAGRTATFSVAAASGSVTNPYSFGFQWQENGQDIEGANSPTYTTGTLTTADSGKVYRCQVILLGYQPLMSAPATLTVDADTETPKLVTVTGRPDMTTVLVTFDELVSSASAENPASYSIPGLTISMALFVNPDPVTGAGRTVALQTSKQTSGTKYTLTVNGVQDISGNTLTGATKQFTGYVEAAGFALAEFYGDIGGATDVGALTSSAKYQAGTPDRTYVVTLAETPTNIADNFGWRMFGLITAPATGSYTFHIAADDSSELWLSSDADPANVIGGAPIAYFNGWGGVRQWDPPAEQGSGQQHSSAITLTQGNKYYFYALAKEGSGGDNLAVGWIRPGQTAIEVIPGQYLSAFVNPDLASITVTQQPTNVTSEVNRRATFRVAATGTSEFNTNETVTIQWQRNGVDIAGATGTTYTTPFLTAADDGAKFKAVLRVPGLQSTSNEALLTVLPDSTPPMVIDVLPDGYFTGVTVTFNELVAPTTATNAANYTIAGLQVTAAYVANPDSTIGGAGNRVKLITSSQAMKTKYNVKVTGVADVAGNAIAAPNDNLDFTSYDLVCGSIALEYYAGIDGVVVNNLVTNANYLIHNPTRVSYPSRLQSRTDFADNYGHHAFGFLVPPVSGNYTFYISADDGAELWLSTDENPANKGTAPIARVVGWTPALDWANATEAANQKSAAIALEAGKRYWIEAFNKEGGGGDNLAVGWVMPDTTNIVVIPGSVLCTYASPQIIADVTATGADADRVIAWSGQTFTSTQTSVGSNGVYTVGSFGEDALAYTDRTHEWNGATSALRLPDYLVGNPYVMNANDNRNNTALVMNVQVTGEATVYLLVDNRTGDNDNGTPPTIGPSATLMKWVDPANGWNPVITGRNRFGLLNIPDEVGIDEGGNGSGPGGDIQQYASVYAKYVSAAGVVVFNEMNEGRNMYGVVVKPGRGPGAPAAAGEPTLTYTRDGNNLILTFEGTLQESGDLKGAWGDVQGTSPLTVPMTSPMKFYRAKK